MVHERRFTPRYPVNFKLKLISNQQQLPVMAVNLSAGGIQVKCDDHCVEILSNTQRYPLTCQITIDLPNSTMAQSLTIDCRVIIKRRLSQSHYLLGMKFIDLSAVDRDLMMNYYR